LVVLTARVIIPEVFVGELTMARVKSNGDGRLSESIARLNESMVVLNQAMATLVQNQAAFQAQIAESNARLAMLEAEKIETNRINSERFARIEAILLEHSRILKALPEAIREKIGFKPPEPPPTA
jgi:hypothetical protein